MSKKNFSEILLNLYFEFSISEIIIDFSDKAKYKQVYFYNKNTIVVNKFEIE